MKDEKPSFQKNARPLLIGRLFPDLSMKEYSLAAGFLIHSQQKGFSPFAPLGEFLF
ncbi:MAG: hypothetical protein WBC98_05385 [Candidatus Zixiibacteriota bacterium]